MMKTRVFPAFMLVAVLLAACVPNTSSPPAQADPPLVPASTATPPADVPSPTPETAATQTSETTPIPAATSRGPNLEATDPSTVSLASGGLQFVEFFRFT